MKKSKKAWAIKPKHSRKDNFNWKKISWYDKAEMRYYKYSSECNRTRRAIEMQNLKKIMRGADEIDFYWPGKRFVNKDWYWI